MHSLPGMGKKGDCPMKTSVHLSALLALAGSFLMPPAVAYASPTPADSAHFCQVIDPEEWERERALRPAAKRLQDLNVGEPRTVRLFYFLPNDRPYRADVVDSMKTGIVQLQSFFADQMEAHGHGSLTFQFEADDQGDPVVHRVDGDYADSHYSSRGGTDGEIQRAFDNSQNIILIIMDVSASSAHGRGSGGKGSGWAIVYGDWNWFAAAHELGHSFDLEHDFRDNEYIMSYGRADRSSAKLSACAAEFLTAHPYFNSDVPLQNESHPTVELVSSSEYPFGSESMPVQLRVRDDDGLHQLILFVMPKNPFLGGTPEVKACHGLSAATDTVVEFNFDGRLPSDNVGTSPEAHTTLSNTVQHRIHVIAVDTDGNRNNIPNSSMQFNLEAGHSRQHIATVDRPYYYDIGGIAISHDGSHLAIGTGGIVELMDATERERITNFRHTEGNRYTNWSVAFSHDGTLLASGSANGTIKVWNVNTREEAASLDGHTGQVLALDFSPDGTMLASGSWDNTVKLWDVTTWTNIGTLEGHTGVIVSLEFLPDGKLATKSGGDGTVKLWDVQTRSQNSTINTDAVGRVAVSPDGATLASSISWAIKLWSLSTGVQTGALNHMREYNSARLAFSPDGTVLAVTANGLIEIWDVPARELLATISGGPGGVGSMLFSPNGKQLIGTANKGIKFWDVSEWASSITSVCGRTPQVRDAIVGEVAGVSSCGNVTEAHLAAITTNLYLNDKEITTLKEGDFEGMSELPLIDLRSNQLTTLPEGVFSGLAALTLLTLSDNRLTALPEGVFSGLSELTELYLRDNLLTTLPEGVFSGLAALTDLHLYNNQLTALPESVFNGLSALGSLDLHGNQLTTLPEGMLSGLTSLTYLNLESNQLTTLPDSIFTGLTGLTRLAMGGNAVDPLQVAIFLEKTGEGEFKAVAPAGVPFEIVLPIRVRNGSISSGATSLTIPVGSVESDTLTVTRATDTSGSGAVSVWIGLLPSLPANHTGYRLVRNTDEFRPLKILEDISEIVWSGTITAGSWGNAFANRNATGFGYSRRANAGSISHPTFSYRGTTYRIQRVATSYIGSRPSISAALTISPALPSCDESRLRFVNRLVSNVSGRGGNSETYTYYWDAPGAALLFGRSLGAQLLARLTLHPTVPDAPTVTATNEGNQVTLFWTTCDGGKDITRHEYQQKTTSGTFGSWIPIPNSGAGGVNVASYTLTGVNSPQEQIFEVRAVNEIGDGSISAPVSPSDRTPKVAAAILNAVRQNDPNVVVFADITDSHLHTITILRLGYQNITALKSGDFSGLTALTHLNLPGNQLSSLPDSIFAGLTALTQLRLGGNSVTPLPLTVSLEKVGADQVKAVAPTGAPFEIVLPLTIANGNISGGATTISIPRGSVESQPLTVTRTTGTTAAVTVDIGTLPGLPNGHFGYSLVKSNDQPLEVISSGEDGTTTAATDFNGDGQTDFADFFLLIDAFGGTDSRFDLDGSGTVDFVDFFQFLDAFDQSGQAKLVALAQEMVGLPAGPQLQQNAPNPFNSETVISWFLLKPGLARVEVFALTGQRVAVLHRGPLQAGFHRVHWDGRDDAGRVLASGVYLYRLVIAETVLTRKLTLLR